MRILSVLLAILLLNTYGCTDRVSEHAAEITGGSPERGRALIKSLGCGSCHTIPGVTGADAVVGPPLIKMANRGYIAGVRKNTPENMIDWLKGPPHVDPQTAMPDLKINDQDARDIASYLYTLK